MPPKQAQELHVIKYIYLSIVLEYTFNFAYFPFMLRHISTAL